MNKTIISALICLAIAGCGAKKGKTAKDTACRCMSNSHDFAIGYRQSCLPSDSIPHPAIDSTVEWIDGNGSIHVEVWAKDFPVPGDSGTFYIIATQ